MRPTLTKIVIGFVLLFTVILPVFVQAQTEFEVLSAENITQVKMVGELSLRYLKPSYDFAWSPDGKQLAITTYNGTRVIDFDGDGMRFGHLYGDTILRCVAYSPDGKLLASCNAYDNTIFLWDTTTGNMAAALLNAINQTDEIAFSPDGTLLAVKTLAGENGVTLWGVWDDEQRQPITASNALQIQKLATFTHETRIMHMDFSVDGSVLAMTSANDNMLHIWDPVSEELIQSRQLTEIVAATFSPDGRYYAIAEDNIGVLLLDATTFEEIRSIPVEDSDARLVYLNFSPTSDLLSAALMDPPRGNQVQIWDVESGELLNSWLPETWILNKTVFDPSGRFLASHSLEDGVRLWGVGSDLIMQPTPTLAPPAELALRVNGRARVQTTDGDVLNMRNNPSRQGELLTTLTNDTLVSIIDGPQESDGLTWWKVRMVGGLEGWVVEAVDDQQTLIPLP